MYTVTISNSFEVETPEQAVEQMVSYLIDAAHEAGYHVVEDETGESWFIDADDTQYGRISSDGTALWSEYEEDEEAEIE